MIRDNLEIETAQERDVFALGLLQILPVLFGLLMAGVMRVLALAAELRFKLCRGTWAVVALLDCHACNH